MHKISYSIICTWVSFIQFTINLPCFTGLDAGLPGGDLGLVLVTSASVSAAATSVLMLGYSFLFVVGAAGLGGPLGRGGPGRAGGGRPGGVFFGAADETLLSSSTKINELILLFSIKIKKKNLAGPSCKQRQTDFTSFLKAHNEINKISCAKEQHT